MLGEKIELTDHVDSIYDFILDVDYKDQEIVMNLYKKGEFYRNHKMVEDILLNCRPQTKLCIAANITCEGEYIQTRTVKDWKGHVPDLSKIPCIFLLYK